jgi:hypothetical protein
MAMKVLLLDEQVEAVVRAEILEVLGLRVASGRP